MRRAGYIAIFIVGLMIPVVPLVWVYSTYSHQTELPSEESIREAAAVPQPPATVLLTHGRHILEGRVTRNGRPEGLAKVELQLVSAGHPSAMIPIHMGLRPSAEGPDEIAALTTRADGKFQFAGLTTGVYRATATASDGATASRSTYDSPPVPMKLELVEQRQRLSGSVRWSDGSAFRGFVSANSDEDHSVRPDEEGRFDIDGLAPGSAWLEFHLPGRYEYGDVFPVGRDSRLEIVLDEGAEERAGRILAAEDGSPVVGAQIKLSVRPPPARYSATVHTVTGEDGFYRAMLRRGGVQISVEAEGFARRDEGWTGRDVRLLRTGRAAGLVVAADGAPVRGVPVHSLERFPFYHVVAPATRSGEDGAFAVEGINTLQADVYALGAGWASEELSEIAGIRIPIRHEIPPGGTAEVELRVMPAGRAEGRVVDARGAPLAGIPVTVHTGGAQGTFRHEETVVTGAAGEFVFDTLVPGLSYRLTAVPRDGIPWEDGPSLAASGETIIAELVLPEPRPRPRAPEDDVAGPDSVPGEPVAEPRIESADPPSDETPVARPAEKEDELRLEVLGPDGQPVALCNAAIRAIEHKSPVREVGPGVFRILDPGAKVVLHVRFAVAGRGVRPGSLVHGPIELTPGSLTLKLPAGRTIEGRIVGPDGKGLRGLPVSATCDGGRVGGRGTLHSRARTGEGGRFVLRGLADERYRVGPRVPGGFLRPGSLAAHAGAKHVDFRLAPAARISVIVHDPDGKPAKYVHVIAIDARTRKWVARDTSSQAGVAELHHLVPGGEYDLRVIDTNSRRSSYVAGVRPGPDPVSVRLTEGAVVKGRIRGPEGHEGTVVWASLDRVEVFGDVSEDGSFEIRGLTPERWKIRAFATGRSGADLEGTAEVLAPTEVEITLRRR